MIAGAVLAAGAGARFGAAPKQLALLDGRPLLEHALSAMTAARAVDRSIVVLGASAPEILEHVDLHGAEPLCCTGWREGRSAALRALVVAVAGECDALVVALGDQPRIAPAAIDKVLGGLDGRDLAARAVYDGVPGHPVALDRRVFPSVLRLRGDRGARDLLREVGIREIDCTGLGSPVDVDTLEQLKRLERLERLERVKRLEPLEPLEPLDGR